MSDSSTRTPRPLLSQNQAAELLGGVSPRTLERWRLTGEGPRFVKVGRRALYRPEDLEAYIQSRVRRSTSEAA